jgi:hypothetical protein
MQVTKLEDQGRLRVRGTLNESVSFTATAHGSLLIEIDGKFHEVPYLVALAFQTKEGMEFMRHRDVMPHLAAPPRATVVAMALHDKAKSEETLARIKAQAKVYVDALGIDPVEAHLLAKTKIEREG